MVDSEARDQKAQRSEHGRMDLLYKTVIINNAIRKCNSEGSTSVREALRVAAYCRWGLMVEGTFIKLDSLIAKGMIGYWNS